MKNWIVAKLMLLVVIQCKIKIKSGQVSEMFEI